MSRTKQAVSRIWPTGYSLPMPGLVKCFPKRVLCDAHRCFMGKGFPDETGMGNAGQDKVFQFSYGRTSLSLICWYTLAISKRGWEVKSVQLPGKHFHSGPSPTCRVLQNLIKATRMKSEQRPAAAPPNMILPLCKHLQRQAAHYLHGFLLNPVTSLTCFPTQRCWVTGNKSSVI